MKKKKVRIQKIFILFFLTFAVFNYNNCEVKVTKENMEEAGSPNTGIEVGDRPIYSEGATSKSGGSEEESDDVYESGDGEIVTVTNEEKYDILFSTYSNTTEDGLHGHLISSCGSCHRISIDGTIPSKGVHGEGDVKTSLDDLLYHKGIGKVDLNDTEKSLIYTKILAGNHYGVTDAESILNYLNLWVSAYENELEALIALKQEEGGGEVIVEEDDNSDIADIEEEYKFTTDVQTIPTLTGDVIAPIVFTIQNVGTLSVTAQFLADQGYYVFKDPTLSLFSGSKVKINDMRGVLNETFSLQYGTWTSTNREWADDDFDLTAVEIGYGTLFMKSSNIGADTLKFIFKDISVSP